MRIVFSELSPNYGTYTFPHAVYAIPESVNEIHDIYDRGFLPYSGDISKTSSAFYLCRSLRVELASFVDSSENRRVDRKMEVEDLVLSCIPKADFDTNNPEFIEFCENYINERFPSGAMPMDRFRYIVNHDLTTHFLELSTNSGDRLGVVFCSLHQGMMHYWFAFFNNDYRQNAPIGKWIMWQCIKWAQSQGMDYIYLGTCYGSKSLYKARDFKGISFFDGEIWNTNVKELKRRVKEDDQSFDVDRWRRDDLLME